MTGRSSEAPLGMMMIMIAFVSLPFTSVTLDVRVLDAKAKTRAKTNGRLFGKDAAVPKMVARRRFQLQLQLRFQFRFLIVIARVVQIVSAKMNDLNDNDFFCLKYNKDFVEKTLSKAEINNWKLILDELIMVLVLFKLSNDLK
jgi:hypothetical protein